MKEETLGAVLGARSPMRAPAKPNIVGDQRVARQCLDSGIMSVLLDMFFECPAFSCEVTHDLILKRLF